MFNRAHSFPIALDCDFGHADPMFPLPLGIRVRLEAPAPAGAAPRLHLLEAAVAL